MSKFVGFSLALFAVLALCFPVVARPATLSKTVYYNSTFTSVCGVRGVYCENWGITSPYHELLDCEDLIPGQD